MTGALYNSAAVLYDRQTESLWAQPVRKAIAGALTGASLSVIPSRRVRWSVWLEEHPNTQVLSVETGYSINYRFNPYEQYQSGSDLIFPVQRKKSDCKIHSKALVLGVEADGRYRAYPLQDLKKVLRVRDVLGSRTLEIVYDAASDSAVASYDSGEQANGTILYWFAWEAFYPETDCLRAVPKSK